MASSLFRYETKNHAKYGHSLCLSRSCQYIVRNSYHVLAYNLLGCSYWMSSAANYVFGSILSYFLNKYFTFRSSGKSWAEIGRFIVSVLFCYLMAYGVAKWATNGLLSSCNVSLRENISMAVGMVLFVVLNYALQRLFVFKKKKL